MPNVSSSTSIRHLSNGNRERLRTSLSMRTMDVTADAIKSFVEDDALWRHSLRRFTHSSCPRLAKVGTQSACTVAARLSSCSMAKASPMIRLGTSHQHSSRLSYPCVALNHSKSIPDGHMLLDNPFGGFKEHTESVREV